MKVSGFRFCWHTQQKLQTKMRKMPEEVWTFGMSKLIEPLEWQITDTVVDTEWRIPTVSPRNAEPHENEKENRVFNGAKNY